ncbi:holo-ACP synthase, partial [candidate division WOR-3 bacterium]|nr:holo-ACP synthase [candidate division WOR-3 bacterium]
MKCEIGIDIIEINRVEKKFKNNLSFEKLIFTDKEMNQVNNKSIKYITLAGKWASKEAFSKALGTGIGKELHWKDIE